MAGWERYGRRSLRISERAVVSWRSVVETEVQSLGPDLARASMPVGRVPAEELPPTLQWMDSPSEGTVWAASSLNSGNGAAPHGRNPR